MKTFTKYLLFCVVALVLLACGNSDYELDNLRTGSSPASSDSSKSSSSVETSDIAFNVQYTRYAQGRTTKVITSKSEIEQYYGNQQIKICDKQDGVWGEQDCNTIEKYSNSYFADNFLVIVELWEPSGSIRHKVERIDENGNIVINRLVPKLGTDDIGQWGIIIELNNNFKTRQFQIVFLENDNIPCKVAAKQGYVQEIPNHIKELDEYKNLDPSCKSDQKKLVVVFDFYPRTEHINWDYVYSHLPGYVPGSGIVSEYGGGSYNVNGIEMTEEQYAVYSAEYWRKYYEELNRNTRSLDIPCFIGSSIALLTDKEIAELKKKYDYLAIEDYIEDVPTIPPVGCGDSLP